MTIEGRGLANALMKSTGRSLGQHVVDQTVDDRLDAWTEGVRGTEGELPGQHATVDTVLGGIHAKERRGLVCVEGILGGRQLWEVGAVYNCAEPVVTQRLPHLTVARDDPGGRTVP